MYFLFPFLCNTPLARNIVLGTSLSTEDKSRNRRQTSNAMQIVHISDFATRTTLMNGFLLDFKCFRKSTKKSK